MSCPTVKVASFTCVFFYVRCLGQNRLLRTPLGRKSLKMFTKLKLAQTNSFQRILYYSYYSQEKWKHNRWIHRLFTKLKEKISNKMTGKQQKGHPIYMLDLFSKQTKQRGSTGSSGSPISAGRQFSDVRESRMPSILEKMEQQHSDKAQWTHAGRMIVDVLRIVWSMSCSLVWMRWPKCVPNWQKEIQYLREVLRKHSINLQLTSLIYSIYP